MCFKESLKTGKPDLQSSLYDDASAQVLKTRVETAKFSRDSHRIYFCRSFPNSQTMPPEEMVDRIAELEKLISSLPGGPTVMECEENAASQQVASRNKRRADR